MSDAGETAIKRQVMAEMRFQRDKQQAESSLPASAIPAGHPESICDDCDGPNVVWHAPNDLWNKVCRPDGETAADPMLCPRCFIARAFKTGIDVAWNVSPNADLSGGD